MESAYSFVQIHRTTRMTENILTQLARVSLLVEMDANWRASTFTRFLLQGSPTRFFPPLVMNAYSSLVETDANWRASTLMLLLFFCLRLARDTSGTLELSKYQMFSAEACDSAEGAQLLNTKQREEGEKEVQQRPISSLQTIRVTGNS